MVSLQFSIINGLSVGAEYVSGEVADLDQDTIVVDLLILRFLFQWDIAEDSER